MDQNSGNGTDKRNWRERLGIGKPGTPATPDDMPRLADDFKSAAQATPGATAQPAQRPGAAKPAPHTPVKAAPMAPRPAARPAPAAGSAPSAPQPGAAKPAAVVKPPMPRAAPVAPDALAAKLKDQREAAERLAVQRVQAAKQRAEAQLQSASAPGDKPKFTFADENKVEPSPPITPVAPPLQRAAAPLVPPPSPFSAGPAKPAATMPPPAYVPPAAPAYQPPRQPLGGPPSYAPSGYQQGGQAYVPPPPYPQAPQYQPGFGNQPYGQQPQYRPVDPATGYAPPPGFTPTNRPSYGTVPQPAGPRLSPPPARGPMLADRTRLQPPRGPQIPMGAEPEGDDVFEAPVARGPRRATANEYQQAYRDEVGYDEGLPRSRGLGMLLGLVVLAVITALLAIYGYSYISKNSRTAAGGGSVPVVAAPAGATKVSPDSNAATTEQAGKKQIYDRIEGDHEVAGSAMKSNEEAPTPPAGNGASQPVQQNGAAQPTNGGGDGTPLPLPPPPGGGTGQQGALSPDGKTDMASLTPAAEPVSAANSSSTVAAAAPVVAPAAADATPPAPGTAPLAATAAPVAALPATGAPDTTTGKEQVGNDPAKPAATTAAAKPAATSAAKPKKDAMKNLVLGKSENKNLGAKPLVLVPPSRIAATATPAPAPLASAPVTAGGLYGDTPAAAAPAPQPLKIANAKPLPAPSSPATGAYVVQLASFNSRAEAQAEYARLSSTHGAIITRYAPIISAGNVAGSTRYQLNLGPIASNDAASNVCAALISAGERDCKVGRQ